MIARVLFGLQNKIMILDGRIAVLKKMLAKYFHSIIKIINLIISHPITLWKATMTLKMMFVIYFGNKIE